MSSLSIQSAYPIFTETDGQPLENGYIWIGTANLDPQTNPIAVYWDAALTIPAAQPIRTLGGYLSRNGSPANIYVAQEYSIRVMSKNGSTIYSAPNGSTDRLSSSQISYLPAGTGAVSTTVQAKLWESISVKDFGAVGNGITDDTAAIQAAINAAIARKTQLLIDGGIYIASLLTINGNISITGSGTIKQKSSTVGHLVTISGVTTKVNFTGITFDGNEQNQASPAVNGTIRITAIGTSSNSAYFKFTNCIFLNGCVSDITVFNDAIRSTNEELFVTGCSFLGGREGISVTDDPRYIDVRSPINYVISDNIFNLLKTPASKGRAGIVSYDGHAYASTDTARGVIANNVMINCGRNDASSTLGAIDIYSYARTTSITGNNLTGIYGRGIQIKSDAKNITISNNVLEGLVGLDAQIAVNRSAFSTVNGEINIIGNTCINSGNDGISISGGSISAGVYGTNFTISSNIIKNATRRGIGVIGVNDTNIVNNIVDTAQTCIHCETLQSNLLVSSNLVNNASGNGIYIAPGSVANISMLSNKIQTCGSRGIYIGSAIGGIISGNTISNTNQAGINVLGVTDMFRVSNNLVTSTLPYFDGGGNTGIVKVENNQFKNALSSSQHTVTIASGVINTFLDWHFVATETSANDDLDTINGGYDGAVVTLRAATSTYDVVVKDGTGNLKLAGDFTMNNTEDSITLKYMGGFWVELCRSDNGA